MIEITIRISTTEEGRIRCQGKFDRNETTTGREHLAAEDLFRVVKKESQTICENAENVFDFFGKAKENDALDTRSLDAPQTKGLTP